MRVSVVSEKKDLIFGNNEYIPEYFGFLIDEENTMIPFTMSQSAATDLIPKKLFLTKF